MQAAYGGELRPAAGFVRGKDNANRAQRQTRGQCTRHGLLVDAVKKVYPIAKIAKARMADMEEELCRLPTKKAQKEYIRQVYHQIKDEYTPVLKHMTRTQGKVLLKLIDRETEYTAYEVLKEFRGGFVAGFWQGVSRIFGQNLKSQYDKDNEDKMIEQIVIYYEAGLLR